MAPSYGLSKEQIQAAKDRQKQYEAVREGTIDSILSRHGTWDDLSPAQKRLIQRLWTGSAVDAEPRPVDVYHFPDTVYRITHRGTADLFAEFYGPAAEANAKNFCQLFGG